MRMPIRVGITSLILGVLVVAVASVVVASHSNGIENAEDLSGQIVEQTLRRIELRTWEVLETATGHSAFARAVLESGQLTGEGPPDAGDFPTLSTWFASTLEVNQELSYFGYALEATGEYCVAERKADGAIEVREYAQDEAGRMHVRYFAVVDGARSLLREEPWDGYDPRKRPFYGPAKSKGRQTWTDTYAFWDTTATSDSTEVSQVPGVSCVTPTYATVEGERVLTGVIDADFDLFTLCDFLGEIERTVGCLAFVTERRVDGALRVIAHPDPSQLLETVNDGERVVHRLAASYAELKDQRVAAFVEQVAARPLATGAAIQRLPLEHADRAYFAGYLTLAGDEAPPWTLCMLLPRDAVMGTVDANNRYTLLIAAASLLAAIVLGFLLSARLSTPVSRVAARSQAVGRLELDHPPLGVSRIREVDRLTRATDDMMVSLRSFQKYVPTEVVRDILDSGEQARPGAQAAELTVFFTDIAGFTTLSESLSPPELVAQLGEFLEETTQAIRREGGTVDKFIGDAVVAFWGAPRPNPDQAVVACRAALDCQARLRRLRAQWTSAGRPLIHARIGLNTGQALVGNLGSPSRLDYTAIGEEVGFAERMEELCKKHGSDILIGEGTYRAAEGRIVARLVDEVEFGEGRPTKVYELLEVKA